MVNAMLSEIYKRLDDAFSPCILKIKDDSHRHEGHIGYDHGSVSHIQIDIMTDAFAGLSKLERHRRIFQALGKDLEPSCKNALHAVQIIRALAPGEG